MSIRSCIGVRERRYPGTADGWMPSEEANAAFLAGCSDSTWICLSTSQLATFCVPPYRVGEDPLMLRVGAVPDVGFAGGWGCDVGCEAGCDAGWDAVGDTGGVSGGGVASLAAVDSVNGSGPEAAAGCRKTSLPAVVLVPPLPLGLVSTTARATAAAMATIVVASRGTERHQGLCGGSGGMPPEPPGGAGGGGGGGPSRPPDKGPEGGPVGRPDDGGGCDGGCDGCVGHGGCWPEG